MPPRLLRRHGFFLPPATAALIVACLVAYGLQLAAGVNWWDAAAADLLRLGANYAPAVAAGEGWRLLTSLFLHGGLLHLVVNMLALADIGSAVERRFGPWRTLAVFLLTGALGALVSAVRHSEAISIGASAAIFGLFGVWLLAAARGTGEAEAPAALGRRRLALGVYAVVALGSGFLLPAVDNAAHLGGFAGGLGFALLLGRDAGAGGVAAGVFWPISTAAALLVVLAAQALPAEWALPYREGRRFDAVYHDFAVADRWIGESLQRIGRESRAGRLSEAEALARLDAELLPVLRQGYERWQGEHFADGAVDKERAFWVEYARLRLDAVLALRAALSLGDPRLARRFETKMAAAAALLAAVGQRRAATAESAK